MEPPVTSALEVVHSEAVGLLSKYVGGVQLIVTDPPYGISYQTNYRASGNGRPVMGDWSFNRSRPSVNIGAFFASVLEALTDGGAAYIFSRWDVYPLWVRSIPLELTLKNVIVWVKDNWSAGDLEGNYGNQWEAILFLAKGRHKLLSKRWPNVWNFPRVPAGRLLVPTQKPVELIQRIIESSCPEGGLVIDPFCGSGTTGEACRKLNRDCILGDLDKDMVSIARERLFGEKRPRVETLPIFSPSKEQGVDMSSLDGVHPDDVAFVAQYFRSLR